MISAEMKRGGWTGIALIVFLACVFGAIAPAYVARYHIPFAAATGIYVCFLLQVTLVVVPGLRLAGRFPAPLLAGVLCLPYLAYAAGTGDFRWLSLARLVGSCVLPLLIYELFRVRDPERFHWQDLAVAIWLIWVLLLRQLSGIWTVPVNLDFMGRLFLISLGAWTWVFVRPVPELGYEFWFTERTFKAAALNFVWFALIAVPSSLVLHFTQWNPKLRLPAFLLDYLEIFLFIALLEELFFRGFLQTLLSRNFGSKVTGQIVVSCLFGLFHILHAPFPNWRYVALATVAGWFYGSAFLKGGNLMASALTHAMVDTLWRALFLRA